MPIENDGLFNNSNRDLLRCNLCIRALQWWPDRVSSSSQPLLPTFQNHNSNSWNTNRDGPQHDRPNLEPFFCWCGGRTSQTGAKANIKNPVPGANVGHTSPQLACRVRPYSRERWQRFEPICQREMHCLLLKRVIVLFSAVVYHLKFLMCDYCIHLVSSHSSWFFCKLLYLSHWWFDLIFTCMIGTLLSLLNATWLHTWNQTQSTQEVKA